MSSTCLNQHFHMPHPLLRFQALLNPYTSGTGGSLDPSDAGGTNAYESGSCFIVLVSWMSF